MVATVRIIRLTGSTPTITDITNINTRANSEDSHSVSSVTNPIRIPTSGKNYSFWVCTRLDCSVAPSGTINNIKWYTDGTNSLGTGVNCKMNTATTYIQATGTTGVTGVELTTNSYSTLNSSPVNAFSFTANAPKSVSGSTQTTGQFGDLVVYQIEVESSAIAGNTGTETFFWQYDET